MRQLDFNESKVQVLTLDELEATYHENMVDGSPVGGVYHFVLIHELLERFKAQGLHPEVQEIFAANNRDSKRPGVTVLPHVEAQFGERALEAHVLRRVYANIAIHDGETDETVTNLGVAYHQKGIQIAIGPMVRVCHNQTILGARDVVSNYQCWGGQRLTGEQRTLDHLYDCIDRWAGNYATITGCHEAMKDKMKSELFTPEHYLKTIGLMVDKRVHADSPALTLNEGEATYPLNGAQINQTVERLAVTYKADETTFWDAYQCFNFVLKGNQADIPTILPQSLALFQTMREVMEGIY